MGEARLHEASSRTGSDQELRAPDDPGDLCGSCIQNAEYVFATGERRRVCIVTAERQLGIVKGTEVVSCSFYVHTGDAPRHYVSA